MLPWKLTEISASQSTKTKYLNTLKLNKKNI